jgi:hypothetical protein
MLPKLHVVRVSRERERGEKLQLNPDTPSTPLTLKTRKYHACS